MGYFPICMDIRGKTVLLVGQGPQTDEKLRKLLPFGPVIRRIEMLTEAELTEDVAFVVAGDLPGTVAARISQLCQKHRVPVNVVDQPALCTFSFPALISRGNLTVSVSTGGGCPGAAGYLARQLEESLPDRTEEILDWLSALRQTLYETEDKNTARRKLQAATQRAFREGRPLTDAELQ